MALHVDLNSVNNTTYNHQDTSIRIYRTRVTDSDGLITFKNFLKNFANKKKLPINKVEMIF